MMREEIRRRALGAAAAVSFTLGLAGCATDVIGGGATTTTTGAGGESGEGGAPATTAPTGGVGNAGVGGAGGAGGQPQVIVDAGSDATDCTAAADWATCCEAQMWNADAGCLAWGPPMPPAMPEVA